MKEKNKQQSYIHLIMIIVIVLLINMISVYVFFRLDCSKDKSYSISEASINIVKSLKEPLKIRIYFSNDLPGNLADTRRYINDLLTEYQTYSNGMLQFEFVDPANDEVLKKEASDNKVPNLSVQAFKNEKIEYQQVYMGMVLWYNSNREVLPVINNTTGLEYNLTSAISRVMLKSKKLIAVYEHIYPEDLKYLDELDITTRFNTAYSLLSATYDLERATLYKSVPGAASMLLFTGTMDSLSLEQRVNLDRYIMGGGQVLFFQDRIMADMESETADEIKTNIFDILLNYGVLVKPALAQDAVCLPLRLSEKQGNSTVPLTISYPFFPLVHDLNQNLIITKNLDNLLFEYVSELSIKTLDKNIVMTPLCYTSSNSYERLDFPIDISYQQYRDVNVLSKFDLPPKILSGLYQGKFTSAFTGTDLQKKYALPESNTKAKIIMVPDIDFISNDVLSSNPQNIGFFLNCTDYLAGDSLLINMRQKDITYSPLKEMKPENKRIIRYLNLCIPGLSIILTGLWVLNRERRRKKILKGKYE